MCLLVRKQEQIICLVWMIVFWGVKKVVFTFLMEVFLFLFVFYVFVWHICRWNEKDAHHTVCHSSLAAGLLYLWLSWFRNTFSGCRKRGRADSCDVLES